MPVAKVAGSGRSAVAPPFGKKTATAAGMFSNLILPSTSGFIFERYEPPQRHPLSFAQRIAAFQPMSSPVPLRLVKPSGAPRPLKTMFRDSSRISARAKYNPTAADHCFANVQAKLAL